MILRTLRWIVVCCLVLLACVVVYRWLPWIVGCCLVLLACAVVYRSRWLPWIVGCCLVLLACGIVYRSYASPPLGPMGELMDPEEDVLTSQILADGVSIVNATRTDGTIRRDGHPKTQGCALANFMVNALDWPYRQGLFAKVATYKAWIRFSSGNPTIQSDWYPDARGMAIKVLGVPGKKLLEGEGNERTQDFVMMNSSAFFIDSVRDYARLTRLQNLGYQLKSGTYQFRYFLEDEEGPTWNPLHWRWREFRIAVGMLKWPPKNLLAQQYYSISAYTLGVQNYVKYSARAVACSAKEKVPGGAIFSFSGDALHNSLRDQINLKDQGNNRRNYCFDLLIQPQVQQKNMPVEDTTIEWKESDSPFIPVARVEIAPQKFIPVIVEGGNQQTDLPENKFCENLSFSPWHSLPEHRPVGGLNRIRKAVYQGISQYRHCMNGAVLGEPKEDGSLVLDGHVCTANQPIPNSTANTTDKPPSK